MTDSTPDQSKVRFLRLQDFNHHDVGTIVSQLARQLAKLQGLTPVTSHPLVELASPGFILEVPFDEDLIDHAPKRFAIHIKQTDIGVAPSLILTWPADADPDYKPLTEKA